MDTTPAVRRTKVAVAPNERHDTEEYGDEQEIRVYYSERTPPMPSVSVIKELREDPERDDALAGWSDRYDGQSQWGRPWWRDQRQFKASRGVLVHFVILSELGEAAGDTYYHRVGDDNWGREEYEAEYTLKKWSTNAPSANSTEVPYTPRENKYDGVHAWDKAKRGARWAASAFHEQIIQANVFDPTSVEAVEEFVVDEMYGYGGQFDLLFEHEERGTVIGDLKTSSGVRFGNKLQLAAYAHAVETSSEYDVDSVDDAVIFRLHPDSETVEVSWASEWDRSLEGLTHEFLGLADHARHVAYPDTLAEAREELTALETGEQTELDAVTDE